MRDKSRMLRGMSNTPTESRATPRSLRAELGIDQSDLAERAGVGLRTVTELEAGRNVSVESIEKIARVLGVTPGALLDAKRREAALRTAAPLAERRRLASKKRKAS